MPGGRAGAQLASSVLTGDNKLAGGPLLDLGNITIECMYCFFPEENKVLKFPIPGWWDA